MTERTFAGVQFFVRLAITLLIWKKVLATTTLPPRVPTRGGGNAY